MISSKFLDACHREADILHDTQVGLRLQLWRGSAMWATAVATWHATPFLKLDVPALDATVARYESQLQDMEAGLPANEVPAALRLICSGVPSYLQLQPSRCRHH